MHNNRDIWRCVVEYEYYIYGYDFWEEPYVYQPERQSNFAQQYFDTKIYASLTVKDKEVIDFEIDDFYI